MELRRRRRAKRTVIISFVLASLMIAALTVMPAAASNLPVVAILSVPKVRTSSTTVTFHVTKTQPGMRLSCSLDGASFAPCTSVVFHTRPPQWGIRYYHLGVGRHCLSAIFTDNAHSRSRPTTRCWTIIGTRSSVTIRHLSGTPQSAPPNAAFPSLLTALVVDSHFHPVLGARVMFSAPSTGASSMFAHCQGGNPRPNSCVVVTNASGLATTSKLTANDKSGAYAVLASALNAGVSATFSLVNSAAFTISGSITKPLYPGGGQSIDLVLTNPNSTALLIKQGAISIAVTSTRAGCMASRNFVVTHGLDSRVTVPPRSTMSLSNLSISEAHWPVIAMIETNSNQDACEGDRLELHYSGIAAG